MENMYRGSSPAPSSRPKPDGVAYLPVMASLPPQQQITAVYEPDKALERGTLFPELDKPWMVGGDCCE